MTLSYRKIERKHHARQIWEKENTFPDWYLDARAVWTPDYRSFLKFWRGCREVWGLFDGADLAACVYLEFKGDAAVQAHVSITRPLPEERLVEFYRSLVAHKRSEGVLFMEAWLLKANRTLRRITAKTGFVETGLVMDFGVSRGRLLRWVQVKHPNP